MTNEVIDIYFSTSTKNQQQKVRLPNWFFVLCEKRHNHIFIIMRDDESMEKGEKAHKALFVYSISFGQSKCSMKFALFF